MTDHASVWAEITKADKQDDGSLLVEGTVSDETVDIDQQIADDTWLKDALPEWFKYGNIREQHGLTAAGVATEYDGTGDTHKIKALIVDPGSVKKVEARVLKGFSIGIKAPRVIRDTKAAGGRIVGGQIIEVSLVDRPANPSCTLTLAKAATAGTEVVAADFDEERGLVKVEELLEKAPSPPVPAVSDALLTDVVTHEVAPIPTVAGDEPCDCCAQCPGASCPGDCCAACRVSKQPAAAAQAGTTHEGEHATNGPNAVKAPEADLTKMPKGMTSNDVRQALEAAIRETAIGRAADWCWVNDFTDTVVIFNLSDTYFQQKYTIDDAGAVTLSGDPTEVVQHTNWQPKAASASTEEDVTPETIMAALKTGQITPETLRELADAPTGDTTKSPDADTPEAPAPEAEEQSDTVKAAVAEAVKAAVEPLLARLGKVEQMAAPGGPSRTRGKAAEITAHRGDELRAQIAAHKATAKSIDSPDLAKAYIDLAAEAERELNKLVAG